MISCTDNGWIAEVWAGSYCSMLLHGQKPGVEDPSALLLSLEVLQVKKHFSLDGADLSFGLQLPSPLANVNSLCVCLYCWLWGRK